MAQVEGSGTAAVGVTVDTLAAVRDLYRPYRCY